MVTEAIRRIVLFSIRPVFAEQIMAGDKRVEFRKTRLREDVSHAVVYATSPIQRVIGYFDVRGITTASPADVWTRFRAVGGIDREQFDAYYAGSEMAVAIIIGTPVALHKPAPLSTLGRAISAPQSYRYLPRSAFRRLQERAQSLRCCSS